MSEPPPAEPELKGKSKLLAIGLALIFGPLGLLYIKAWENAVVMILIGAPFVLTRPGGMGLTIGSRILSAAWAYCLLIEQDEAPNFSRDSSRLLNEAARLESVDRAKAVAVYEEIVRLYPDTVASKEAARSIQTLTRQA
jgi:hypothetical protein